MKQSVLQKLQVASKLRHQQKQVPVIEKPKVLTFEEKQAMAKSMVKLYNLEAQN